MHCPLEVGNVKINNEDVLDASLCVAAENDCKWRALVGTGCATKLNVYAWNLPASKYVLT